MTFEHSILPITEGSIIADLKKYGLPIIYGQKFPRIADWQYWIWDELDDYVYYDKKDKEKVNPLPNPKVGKRREYATGFAVNTGRAGLVVIDLDVKDGKNAIELYEQVCADLAVEPYSTLTVRTGSGGLHVYYLAGEYSFTNSAHPSGVDIRAMNGCVVGPTSKVYDSDNGETVKDARTYTIEYLHPIRPLPKELAGWIATMQKDKPESNSATLAPAEKGLKPESDLRGLTPHARKTLIEAVDLVSRTVASRNEALSNASRDSGAAGVPVDIVVKELTRAAQGAPDPLDNDEIDRTVERRARDGYRTYELPTASSNEWEDTRLADRALQALDMRYNVVENCWYAYNASRGVWEIELSPAAVLKKWLDELVRKLEKRNDEGDYTLAGRLSRNHFRGEVLKAMRESEALTPDTFDRFYDVVAVRNGVLNLKTKELTPFDNHLYLHKFIDVDYVPDATSPLCDQALKALPDDAVDWFKIMMGQALIDKQPATSTIMFMYGEGGNGKSVLMNLMAATAGTYGKRPPQKALMGEDDFSKLEFEGARQALIEELPKPKRSSTAVLNLDMIKELLGTEEISARRLYQDFRKFRAKATIFISTNHFPRVHDNTYAAWRRLKMIPFTKNFTKSEGIAEMEDIHLNREVREAFFAMRVDAASKWLQATQTERKEVLEVAPKSVQDFTAKWRYDDDPINLFMEEVLVIDEDKSVPFAHLRAEYQAWAKLMGHKEFGANALLNQMAKARDMTEFKTVRGYQKDYEVWVSDREDVQQRPQVVLGIGFHPDFGHFDRNLSKLPAGYKPKSAPKLADIDLDISDDELDLSIEDYARDVELSDSMTDEELTDLDF